MQPPWCKTSHKKLLKGKTACKASEEETSNAVIVGLIVGVSAMKQKLLYFTCSKKCEDISDFMLKCTDCDMTMLQIIDVTSKDTYR